MDVSRIGALDATAGASPTISPGQWAERTSFARATQTINNSNIFGADHELTFVLDRATQKMVFRVIDRTTRDVVTQLPPEYVLRLSEALQNGSGMPTA